ncbi:glycosyltransferase family 2 protein [Rubinisphaera sp.]|uniref:glycosyltransferase family 2 protein n=1 Tax=Rubinisphaera sp. TaxID=2024857 RepID=UPI0025FAB94A|nr:glycosyltransferase family 2 protein [Rubinisphaera sp.]|tara:strand:+ start:52 stop:810 length:759 start_codon:yes stop_codon:yes gene_type:complete
MMSNWYVTLPVFNEISHVQEVLDEVSQYADNILVVDDGSTDGTREYLQQRDDISLICHPENRGYGAALISAFDFAVEKGIDAIISIDCDGQHQPKLIPEMIEALFCNEFAPIDIVSGSRYLDTFAGDVAAPEDRRQINRSITTQLNEQLGLELTDTFCGFKAYRTEALAKLNLTETGYAMPLQLWIQAACQDLKIEEFAVPRIYLEEERSFGGSLDDAKRRMAHYQDVISRELDRLKGKCGQLPVLQGTSQE